MLIFYWPVVCTIQSAVEQVATDIQQQLNGGIECEQLIYHALAIRNQQPAEVSLSEDQQEFDTQSESGSVFSLASELSSYIEYNNMGLYDQWANFCLWHKQPQKIELTLYRIDVVANFQVGNKCSSFLKLFISKINCKLGSGYLSIFEGI